MHTSAAFYFLVFLPHLCISFHHRLVVNTEQKKGGCEDINHLLQEYGPPLHRSKG